MKALILAAGRGERLRPLTNNIPKVMIKVGSKPCLQHNLELLKKYGIKEVAVNTHYLPEKIKEYFQDGKKFGIKIRYSYEPKILGTAGALNNFKDFFKGKDFCIIYGDIIHQTNLGEMFNAHKKQRGLATIALDKRKQVGKGIVILEKNRVVTFVEKPKEEIPNGLVNSGVYMLQSRVFEYIPEGFSDFGKDIFPKMLQTGEKMYGFKTGKVIDIGTIEDLKKAQVLFH